jgi:hypothetical protein
MNLKIVIIILAFPLFFEKCNCSKDCLDETYSFQIYVKGYPVMDSVAVSDTVWFEINESTSLKDLTRNSIIDFANATNLGSAIGLDELLGSSQRKDAVTDFSYVLVWGSETNSVNPARFKEYIFKEEANKYIFKLGIVPKKQGIFRIGFSDAANVYRKNNSCTKANFKIFFKDTNQHLYFNDQNFGITTPLPSNMYCFKVK